MFKKFFIICILLFLGLVKNGISQTINDTILLLNGETIYASVIDTAHGVTKCKNLQDGNKNFLIDNERIFSIRNSNGENLMYVYDTIIGNEFTIDEMRYFIKGEQDAQKGFKARGSLYTNIFIGLAAGSIGTFLCPVPPFAFAALTGVTKVKIKKKSVSDPEYLKHITYIMGYERVARSKRKLSSIISGGAGLVGGLGIWAILKKQSSEILK